MTAITKGDVEDPTPARLTHGPDIAATLRSDAMSGCNLDAP